jgi:hypothetical protein
MDRTLTKNVGSGEKSGIMSACQREKDCKRAPALEKSKWLLNNKRRRPANEEILKAIPGK